MLKIKGSCCCGSIKFELTSQPSMAGMCHCSRCRKVGASALAFIDKSSFHLVQGEEFIQRYEPEQPFSYTRTFCKKCGTSLGEIGSENNSFPISINCLDDVSDMKIQFHVFVGSKPAWYDICDNAQQYETSPN